MLVHSPQWKLLELIMIKRDVNTFKLVVASVFKNIISAKTTQTRSTKPVQNDTCSYMDHHMHQRKVSYTLTTLRERSFKQWYNKKIEGVWTISKISTAIKNKNNGIRQPPTYWTLASIYHLSDMSSLH